MTDYTDLDALPRGYYGFIMPDPPWSVTTRSPKGLLGRPQHYKRMTLTEIKSMPVADLAAPDCWLALWTTAPHLEMSFEVARAWGFAYSSRLFEWVKLNPRAPTMFFAHHDFHKGMGYTSRKNSEPCLLFKKGRPKRLSGNIDELIIAPRREHSRKPEEAYERALKFAAGPHLELFSRQERQGWDTWGDEAGKFNKQARLAHEGVHEHSPAAKGRRRSSIG